jgi:hypothetical protein
MVANARLFKQSYWKTGVRDCMQMIANRYSVINFDAENLKIQNHIGEAAIFEMFDLLVHTMSGDDKGHKTGDGQDTPQDKLRVNNLPATVSFKVDEVEHIKTKGKMQDYAEKIKDLKYRGQHC